MVTTDLLTVLADGSDVDVRYGQFYHSLPSSARRRWLEELIRELQDELGAITEDELRWLNFSKR